MSLNLDAIESEARLAPDTQLRADVLALVTALRQSALRVEEHRASWARAEKAEAQVKEYNDQRLLLAEEIRHARVTIADQQKTIMHFNNRLILAVDALEGVVKNPAAHDARARAKDAWSRLQGCGTPKP